MQLIIANIMLLLSLVGGESLLDNSNLTYELHIRNDESMAEFVEYSSSVTEEQLSQIDNSVGLGQAVVLPLENPVMLRIVIRNDTQDEQVLFYPPSPGNHLYFEVVTPDNTMHVVDWPERAHPNIDVFQAWVVLMPGDSVTIESFLFEMPDHTREFPYLSPVFASEGKYIVRAFVLQSEAFEEFVTTSEVKHPSRVPGRCLFTNPVEVNVEGAVDGWGEQVDFLDVASVINGSTTFHALGVVDQVDSFELPWLNWLLQNQPLQQAED